MHISRWSRLMDTGKRSKSVDKGPILNFAPCTQSFTMGYNLGSSTLLWYKLYNIFNRTHGGCRWKRNEPCSRLNPKCLPQIKVLLSFSFTNCQRSTIRFTNVLIYLSYAYLMPFPVDLWIEYYPTLLFLVSKGREKVSSDMFWTWRNLKTFSLERLTLCFNWMDMQRFH